MKIVRIRFSRQLSSQTSIEGSVLRKVGSGIQNSLVSEPAIHITGTIRTLQSLKRAAWKLGLHNSLIENVKQRGKVYKDVE